MMDKQKIMEELKLSVSISEFEKEEKMKKPKNSILKTGLVASCMVVSITGVVFAKDIGNFIRNVFGVNTSDGVDIAVNNGYVANINTEYQNADGIEIKVDSMIMDDFNFAMNFYVILDKKYDINEFERTWFDDLKIVDESGNVVFSTHQNDNNEGVQYKGAYSFFVTIKNDNEFIVSLSATGSPETFPKSKKLMVTFSKISTYIFGEGIETTGMELTNGYKGNWNFEVDVPKEFYERETIIYKAKKCNDNNIDLSKIQALLSNTALKISIPEMKLDNVNYELLHSDSPKSIFDKIAIQKEYVETSNGRRFETSQKSDGDGGYGLPNDENKIIDYHQTFNLTSYDTTDKIKVHMFTNTGAEIIIELEK